MFKKILIANRGEIAVRIMRSCREMGIATVAVYSEADRLSLHVRMADEAYLIGPSPAAESYLKMETIIETAKQAGADAIHPGYGFLSENPVFARTCAANGITFIGPSPESMLLLGDKLQGKKTVSARGVPLVPGTDDAIDDEEQLRREAERIGFPLLIKASAGGGGKGIHLVRKAEELLSALRLSQGEAQASFGDKRVFLERYLERPRHIEIQVLADQHGQCIYLGERECSVQRRHQKLIEESPSVAVTPELRARMGEAAVAAAQAAGYSNAGTVEFLLDEWGDFYFLEVNTRLQVEHPVTEWLTGLDLVKEQIRIAAGEPLTLRQEDVSLRGAAIECRITAEDPEMDFLPFTGQVKDFLQPSGPGIRFDHMLYPGLDVTRFYDSLLGKLIVWGSNREEAVERMSRALGELRIQGLRTTVPFHQWAMANEAFRQGHLHTGFVDDHWAERKPPSSLQETAAIAAALLEHHSKRRGAVSPPSQDAGTNNWRFAGRRELTRGQS